MKMPFKAFFALPVFLASFCYSDTSVKDEEKDRVYCERHATGSEQYQLVLYYRPDCPYCTRVMKFLEAEGKTIVMRNTYNPRYQRELFRIGGKTQVPCLLINGVPLYESKDIVLWLKEHRGEY